jgi:GT2 family glycosyltransferase
VERLYHYVRSRPETGLATGLMLNKRAGTIRSAGGVLRLEGYWGKHIVGANAPDDGSLRVPYYVSYIPGAMIFTQTSYLRALGAFRRDFFVYCEDDELCLRVARTGRPIVVVPQARVFHFEPPETAEKPVVTFHKQKNFLALYVLHAPAGVLGRAALRYGLGAIRQIWRAGGDWWVYLQARLWVLGNLPRLILDRWQIRRDCKPTETRS